MSKILRELLAVILCFCLVCSLCGVGFAAGADDYVIGPDTEVLLPSDPDGSSAPDTDVSLAPDFGGSSSFVPVLSLPSDVTYVELPDDFVIKSASLDENYAIDPYSLAPVTPGSSSGLKAVLLSILGNYDPIVAQYQYNNGSNYAYIREIQPDYVWLTSAAIFAILLYCTWRIFGGLVCRK